jgi:glycosyltransferase involved in cell wall biosynthesis
MADEISGEMGVKSISSPRLVPAGPLKIAMIVGDNRTLHCGVKDHAYVLAQALRGMGFEVNVIAPAKWSPASAWKFVNQLKEARYDIVHVQYPSIGFRASLAPHLLGLTRAARATVVTLHEYSALPKAQKWSTHVFRFSCNAIMFGSEFEQVNYNRRLGALGAEQHVFPILSQVPAGPMTSERDDTVVHFGQIRPHKGLEAYLDLARYSIGLGKPYQFHILGSISAANEAYAKVLRAQAPAELRWSLDLSFEEVGCVLARSFAAYLPFPDGASERRGSLPAAWLNGTPVLSRLGPATTPTLSRLMIPVYSAEEALAALDRLANQEHEWERISRTVRDYAQSHSWQDVAKQHANIYLHLLNAN